MTGPHASFKVDGNELQALICCSIIATTDPLIMVDAVVKGEATLADLRQFLTHRDSAYMALAQCGLDTRGISDLARRLNETAHDGALAAEIDSWGMRVGPEVLGQPAAPPPESGYGERPSTSGVTDFPPASYCKHCDVFIGFGAVGVVRMPARDHAWLASHCWVCGISAAERAEQVERDGS